MKKKQFENYCSAIIKIMEQRIQALENRIEVLCVQISQQQTQIESERIAKLVAEQIAIKEKDRADKMSEILKQIPQMQQQISSQQHQIDILKTAKHTHMYKMGTNSDDPYYITTTN